MIDIQRICKKSGTKIKKENIEKDKNKREEKKERLAGSRKRKKKQNSLSVLVLHPNVIGQIYIQPKGGVRKRWDGSPFCSPHDV